MEETGVIHGRFQVFHNDHLAYVLAGMARCRHLVVAITNPDPTLARYDQADPDRSASASNPLTYFERYTLVRAALLETGLSIDRFSVVPLPINIPELYQYYVPLEAVFFLTIYDSWGRRKLEQFEAAGLRTEILWERPQGEKGLEAGNIRRAMAAGDPWEHWVPPAVRVLLNKWKIPERINALLTS